VRRRGTKGTPSKRQNRDQRPPPSASGRSRTCAVASSSTNNVFMELSSKYTRTTFLPAIRVTLLTSLRRRVGRRDAGQGTGGGGGGAVRQRQGRNRRGDANATPSQQSVVADAWRCHATATIRPAAVPAMGSQNAEHTRRARGGAHGCGPLVLPLLR
jgi:hypothetical protein